MNRTRATILGLAIAMTALEAFAVDILQNDPKRSPFAYILDYMTRHPGQPECYANEGYLNFLEDWAVDPSIARDAVNGTNYLQRWTYPLGSKAGSPDVTQTLLSGLNAIPGLDKNIYVAVAGSDCDGCGAKHTYLRQVLPKAQLHTDLPDSATHGKSLQCTNGSVYLTQNGSTNMQTVGVTTKANNSLVFVETGSLDRVPPMYTHFRNLWHAVVNSSGTVFPGGAADSSGLNGMTTPVVIGGRPVTFYAGRRNAFVGPTWTDGGLSLPFPANLYPPTEGELPTDRLHIVNWYDQILLDAGAQLVNGEAVTIDIFMFEIGPTNPFVDNLVRLVTHGFIDCPTAACQRWAQRKPVAISKKADAKVPETAFPGQLTVNFHYQFQQACAKRMGCPTKTFQYLNGPITGGSPNYRMTVNKVWQGFTRSKMPGNPAAPFTPQDMHLKVGVLSYGQQVKLYVASSNLDMPNFGSGQKWQAGNTIEMTAADDLYQLYRGELTNIATQGDLSQFLLNTANTVKNSHFDPAVAPSDAAFTDSGIAAFLFPLNTTLPKR